MGTPGTFGNNSGLPQIAGGAKQIPQSFLNHIGREIDRARQSPNIGQVHTQTPGGSNIDISAILQQLSSFYRPLPFEVGLVKVNSNNLEVTIAEGRIFGRSDWTKSKLGTAGFNPAYDGPWSDAGAVKPEPSKNPKPNKNGGSTTPNGTFSSDPNKGGPTSNLPNGGKGSAYSDSPAGNAASITGNTSGTYYTPTNGYNSGNAGSITGNTGSTWHEGLPTFD